MTVATDCYGKSMKLTAAGLSGICTRFPFNRQRCNLWQTLTMQIYVLLLQVQIIGTFFYYKNQKVFQIGKLSKYKTAFKHIVEPTYKQLFKQAVYSTGQIQAYFLNSNPHCSENLPIQNFQVLRHFLFCYG